jgi:adenylosuccinate lyase/3-carboxy-cis,cis-muconate cycloisomerase
MAATKHPLVPLIRALVERCGEEGAWVHWGTTTQDIIDTAFALQAREALAPIGRDLDRATRAAAELARRHANTPMAGRTHAQHAVPITFGLKAATWADELGRARAGLARAGEAALTAQLAGAAGTLATLGGEAGRVQEAFCRRLGLAQADVHWHATRDRVRELAHALDQVSAAAERIAAEVIRLQATEVAELAEPATDTDVGSSTMPQKRNPMTCEYLVAAARLVRAATGAVSAAPAHALERDMGLWAIEWLALPQALILCGAVVDKLAHVLEGLHVDEERMRRNLELTEGQIMAEAVMMVLARTLGHEEAHSLVTAAVRRALAEGRSLRDVLAEDEAVASLAPGELETALDPCSYLGLSAESVGRVTERLSREGVEL